MAPLRTILEAQPRLDIRQNAPYQISLTVTRATTTFTTIVNLSGATNVPPQENPTVVTTPVASPDPIVVSGSSDPSDNTGVVIGATIGALAAALLVMILLWKCCYAYRSAIVRISLARSYCSSKFKSDIKYSVSVVDITTPTLPRLPPRHLHPIDILLELGSADEMTGDTVCSSRRGRIRGERKDQVWGAQAQAEVEVTVRGREIGGEVGGVIACLTGSLGRTYGGREVCM